MKSDPDSAEAPMFPPSGISQMLTVAEAAKEARVSISQIYRAVKGDISEDLPKLPCIRIGRRALIRKVTLEKWLSEIEDSSVKKPAAALKQFIEKGGQGK